MFSHMEMAFFFFVLARTEMKMSLLLKSFFFLLFELLSFALL